MLTSKLAVLAFVSVCLHVATSIMYGLPPLTYHRKLQMEKNMQRQRLQSQDQLLQQLEETEQRRRQQQQQQQPPADEASWNPESRNSYEAQSKYPPLFKVVRGAFPEHNSRSPFFKYKFVG